VDNETTEARGPYSTASVTKYYLFGGQRVALRRGGAVSFLHGDHLGSVSMSTDASGQVLSQARYTPFGEVAWEDGQAQTDFDFTGQRREGFGLMDYNARFYAPSLGRFVSADTIIPDAMNPMAFDHYSYTYNRLLNYSDPSGHRTCTARQAATGDETCDQNILDTGNKRKFEEWELRLLALAVYAESSNGTFDQRVMELTALIYLNRQISGKWSHIWNSVKGNQSAITDLYKPGGDFPLPQSYYENKGWASEQDLIDWVNSTWDSIMEGKFATGLTNAFAAVTYAQENMLGNYDITIIDFSHQDSPVDHKTIEERFAWILETASMRAAADPDFQFIYYGPFYSDVQGTWILWIASNNPTCGQYGSCGPPWPPGTP
jgi:RHS repeat-associated protein